VLDVTDPDRSNEKRSLRPREGGPRDAEGVVALRVLVYSDHSDTRAAVIGALGRHPDPALPELSFVEVATAPMVFAQLDAGVIDVVILDGEATPAGGMGLAKQMKDEVDPCPPILVLLGRADDRWLADWSRADATATLPVDPITLSTTLVGLLRSTGL
jgi:DNA-binding NarL/FixJ family response regulator